MGTDSADEGIPMKRMAMGKPDGRESFRSPLLLRCSIGFACIAVIAGLCAAPLLAMVKFASLLDAALSSVGDMLFGGLLAEVLGALLAVFLWMAYAIWLIIGLEWSRLAGLFLALLG
jgi:hypothetical protein